MQQLVVDGVDGSGGSAVASVVEQRVESAVPRIGFVDESRRCIWVGYRADVSVSDAARRNDVGDGAV